MKREKILMIHLLDWSSRRLSSRHFYISFSLSLFASIVTFNRHSLSKLILNVSKVNCTDTEMCVCVCLFVVQYAIAIQNFRFVMKRLTILFINLTIM